MRNQFVTVCAIAYVIRLVDAETSDHEHNQLAERLSENAFPAERVRYEFLQFRVRQHLEVSGELVKLL